MAERPNPLYHEKSDKGLYHALIEYGMKLKALYQPGYVENGAFFALPEYGPMDSQWQAADWMRARQDNPDGWAPAVKEYWVVLGLPDPKIHV